MFFFTFLAGSVLYSQSLFEWESPVDSVPSDGYYNILLKPEVTGRLKNDLSDIRIYENGEKEVPYLCKRETAISYKTLFREYAIVEKKNTPKCCTNLILHNPSKNRIDNISLIIKNSDVTKKAKLSGSDDNRTWYVIRDNYFFQAMYDNSETTEIKLIDFPTSNYTYYKLEIDDSKNGPVNIIKAGYYNTYEENGKYTEIKVPIISQKDSLKNKRSYIDVKFDRSFYADKIAIVVDGPIFYLRQINIISVVYYKNEKDSVQKPYEKMVLNGELNSATDNTFYLSNYAMSELKIIIENKDDQPLKIRSVKAYQLNNCITAQLQKDKKYSLRFGSKEMLPAEYDIKYFQDKIPSNTPTVYTGDIVNIKKQPASNAQEQESYTFFTNKKMVWAVIILVILLLGFVSLKMLREINSKK